MTVSVATHGPRPFDFRARLCTSGSKAERLRVCRPLVRAHPDVHRHDPFLLLPRKLSGRGWTPFDRKSDTTFVEGHDVYRKLDVQM